MGDSTGSKIGQGRLQARTTQVSRQGTGHPGIRTRGLLGSALRTVALAVALASGTALTAVAAPFAGIVMDARSGKVLWESNADTRLHPASLTKMLTLYIAFDAIKRGEARLDDMVTVSANAARQPPSRLGLRAGQKISLRHLIRAAAIKSANDAASAIGDHLGGNEAAFAERMNRTARALGMSRSTFRNANGLTNEGHLSTARDMNLLGRRLFYDFPQHYPLFSRLSEDAGVARVNNTNRRFLESYRGADGIKTGYTVAAGFNLTASAERGNKRLMATVFGGTSTAQRNRRISELLDIGFNTAPANVRNAPPPPVELDQIARAPAAAAAPPTATPNQRPEPRPTEVHAAAIAQVTSGVADVLADLAADDAATKAAAASAARSLAEAQIGSTAMAGAPPARPQDLALTAEPAAATPEKELPFEVATAEAPRARDEDLKVSTENTEEPEDHEIPFQVVADTPLPPSDRAPDLSEDDEATVALAAAEAEAARAAEEAEATAMALLAQSRPRSRPGEIVMTRATPVQPADEAVTTLAAATAPALEPAPATAAQADSTAAAPAETAAIAAAAPVQAAARVITGSSATEQVAEAAPAVRPVTEGEVVTRISTSGGRHWAVNLGKFPSRSAAERALLQTALAETRALQGSLRKINQASSGWEATFAGLTHDQADLACRRLQARAITCVTQGP